MLTLSKTDVVGFCIAIFILKQILLTYVMSRAGLVPPCILYSGQQNNLPVFIFV